MVGAERRPRAALWVFAGAAAALAARFSVDRDLGERLATAQRREWEALGHLFMRLADYWTFPGTNVTSRAELHGALIQAAECFVGEPH